MPTVTLSQLQQYALDRLEQNTALYPAADLTAAINETYRIVNAHCAINQAWVAVPGFSVANQFLYPVPSPILFPLQCRFEERTLQRLSFGSLAQKYRGWATDTTIKSGPVQRWAPIDITQFVIHPQDSLGGRGIEVQGVVEPNPLSAPGDTISVEDSYISMIVEGASHRLQLREGGKIFAQSSLGLQQLYRDIKSHTFLLSWKAPRYFVQQADPRP